MIKNIITLLFILFVATIGGKKLYARYDTSSLALQNKDLVVLELFTSQSCSSCPPADRVLSEAQTHENIIALGFHVTYWDHLHWKDTLSREFATTRQRQYAAYKNSSRVYTPQMVVNGNKEFVGSNRGQLRDAVRHAKPVKKIKLSKTSNTELQISLPAIKTGTYTIWMFGTQSGHTQNIPSGENRGKSVHYKNAVLTQNKLRSWSGATEMRTLPIPQDNRIDGVTIIVQDGAYGQIRAAGQIKL